MSAFNSDMSTQDSNTSEISNRYESFLESYRHLEIIQDQNEFVNYLPVIINQIKVFRNSCARGSAYQELLTTLPQFFEVLNSILSKTTFIEKFEQEPTIQLKKMTWQLLANVCVQNKKTQSLVWQNSGELILSHLDELTPFTDIQIMIVYNIFKGGSIDDNKRIFRSLVRLCRCLLDSENEAINLEFLHIFLEYFLTEHARVVTLYGPLDATERIIVLQYISSYIREGSSSGPILKNLMEYISKEFKKKSDCVLKTVESYLNSVHPREVISLLDVISKASGEELYSEIYSNDHSLFLNVGSLLQALNSIGMNSENIFTPMHKLEQVAPCSKINTDFEKEISFEMKTMLVRTAANLLYKNKTNQNYARELNIIAAILDCTTTDARNPMIKEWSILAVRNLCENCPENQEFISKLCKVGDAPNEILTELSLDLGSLRIRSNA